ncbi:MAG TPA: TIR domain-containing protein [Thermoleophilaceae bacterium]|nr:TIR domain-containing protein [Thermoleophilaceae bacterium]
MPQFARQIHPGKGTVARLGSPGGADLVIASRPLNAQEPPPTARTDEGAATDLRIFLNYRRDDAADAALHLYERLAAHFGEDHVFMDIDTIDPGVDFEVVLNEAVEACDVLLAVIGRQWLTLTDAKGRRRIDNEDDFVRMELQLALERDVRVLPVLVQGIEMPGREDLPDGLKRLARRNAVELSHSRFNYDLGRLIAALEKVARQVAEEEAKRERVEREKAERERAEMERAEQERAQREREEAERAEQERAQREREEADRAEQEQAEAERDERVRAEAERAEAERVERERVERAQTAREQAERERAKREQTEREQVAKEQADEKARERAHSGSGRRRFQRGLKDPRARVPLILAAAVLIGAIVGIVLTVGGGDSGDSGREPPPDPNAAAVLRAANGFRTAFAAADYALACRYVAADQQPTCARDLARYGKKPACRAWIGHYFSRRAPGIKQGGEAYRIGSGRYMVQMGNVNGWRLAFRVKGDGGEWKVVSGSTALYSDPSGDRLIEENPFGYASDTAPVSDDQPAC